MDASVSVGGIVCFQGGKDTELNARSVTVFLDRADNLDSDCLVSPAVTGLDNLAESTLAKETFNLICEYISIGLTRRKGSECILHLSVRSASGTTI